MDTKTYRLKSPIRIFSRTGSNENDGFIEEVELKPLGNSAAPSDSGLADSCARSLVDSDGNPANPADLAKLNLSEGLRQAFLAQLAPHDFAQG